MSASLALFRCVWGFFHGQNLSIRHLLKRILTMKRTCCALVVTGLAALLILAFQYRGASAKPAETPIERFMAQKLTHAQDVLEGLVTEDFDQIGKAAAEMQTLSQAAEWQVLRTPSYDLFSKEFQSACTQLEKAAKDENTDAASLAYIRVTLTCLSCHKHVRNAKVAQIPILPGISVGINFDELTASLHPSDRHRLTIPRHF